MRRLAGVCSSCTVGDPLLRGRRRRDNTPSQTTLVLKSADDLAHFLGTEIRRVNLSTRGTSCS